ncbi:ORF66 UL49 [Harp seal herpesvirus]|uniref:ORF66 UL49 n=1 Tax=phocid gammaherpesvirus 3 TaxID=2560643 RepID=A0A0R5ZB54_9GAMA|nr:ORF66 UL49 [Harp seal herpesvirus]AJG42993.1 ORF66 UL49 [Harp seal herpesvirus]
MAHDCCVQKDHHVSDSIWPLGNCAVFVENTVALLKKHCEMLLVNFQDLCKYLAYGIDFWKADGVPYWIKALDEAVDLNSYLIDIFTNTEYYSELKNKTTKSKLAKQIMYVYGLALGRALNFGDTFAMCVKRHIRRFKGDALLIQSFRIAVKVLNVELGLDNLNIPWVQCQVKLIHFFNNCKKKAKPATVTSWPLCVPPPHKRREIESTFTDSQLQEHSSLFATREECLYMALKKHADSVPCGNPFNSMVRVLSFEAMIRCQYAVLPVKPDGISPIVDEIYNKVLSYNILWPFFSIPVFSNTASTQLTTQQPPHSAVVCRECGHCLNFGKGKFKKFTFKPTHKFYCRDQKEKHFSICASTGRIYCSFCGSSDIKTYPLKFFIGKQQYIRVVIASNCSMVAENINQEADVVVPCLGQLQCPSVCLKTVSIAALLNFTADPFKFVCNKCTHS